MILVDLPKDSLDSLGLDPQMKLGLSLLKQQQEDDPVLLDNSLSD